MKIARSLRGFTLIELLIVVAIIAILAAIAVPNFLEAQMRSKVVRCKSDMRTLALALESYKIDGNHYPPDAMFYTNGNIGVSPWLLLYRLTTPIAYASSIPYDMFLQMRGFTGNVFKNTQLQYSGEENFNSKLGRPFMGMGGPIQPAGVNNFIKMYGGHDIGKIWALASVGPDKWDNYGPWWVFGGEAFLNALPPILGVRHGSEYDPSNGTISDGDIVRAGP